MGSTEYVKRVGCWRDGSGSVCDTVLVVAGIVVNDLITWYWGCYEIFAVMMSEEDEWGFGDSCFHLKF